MLNPDTPAETELVGWSCELRPGDAIAFEGPGGGGFGDPFHRDPQHVLRDVTEGLVSPEGARQQYGVAVVRGNGRYVLDPQATEKLRLGGPEGGE